jgi:hypothetical protein
VKIAIQKGHCDVIGALVRAGALRERVRMFLLDSFM